MYLANFFIAIIVSLNLFSQCQCLIEKNCSKLCRCMQDDNSSKVQVALCRVNSQDALLQCSVEWPVLHLTVKMYQFDSTLLQRCQRIKRLLITHESALSVLRSDMFQYSSNLENLVVKAPIQTVENGLLRHLYSLKRLDISETKIYIISRAIFEECPLSESLRLVSNNVSFVEDNSFKNCIYLEKLDLSSNLLKKVNFLTFKGIFNLIVLDLSKNKIESIDDFSFKHLKRLKVLSLNGNVLSSIKQDTLHGLETLTRLRLDNNKIIFIATEAFKSLKSIQFINLKENRLSRLDVMVFIHLKALKISFSDVECVQSRDEDSSLVSVDVLMEFEKYPLCDGLKRSAANQKTAFEIQKLVQKENGVLTKKPEKKDWFLVMLEEHPYLIPMMLGGLVVTMISIIVLSVVCHVKNKRIHELRLQEVNLPMMQSTL